MMTPKFSIRRMTTGDVAKILASFCWQNQEQWERYFLENQRGERVTFLAIQDDRVVGYTNLVWQPDYEPFRAAGIPEIDNMHVLDDYQRQGIGTALVRAREATLLKRRSFVSGEGAL